MSLSPHRSHQAWCALIKEQAAGKQSISGFCRSRDLPLASFYHHRKRMRETEGAGFKEVRVSRGSGITLRLEGTALRIEVERGFDAECLRELVDALR